MLIAGNVGSLAIEFRSDFIAGYLLQINQGKVVRVPHSTMALFAIPAVAGLLTWAAATRETVSTQSIFDAPPVVDTGDMPDAFRATAITKTPSSDMVEPEAVIEQTVRVLVDEVETLETPPAGGDVVSRAKQAIARAEAALQAREIESTPARLADSSDIHHRSARLAELQARIKQLSR